jgi:type IV pilus assembly protein PilM
MALGFLTGRGRGSVGLDIDGAYLAAVEMDGDRLKRAVSTDLTPGLVRDGEVEDIHGLTEALKHFVRANDLPRNVRLGVANQQIAVRSMEMPAIEDATERAAAVRFQASEAIAMPLDEAVLDYQILGSRTGPQGTDLLNIIVVAAREPMIMRLVDAVRGAGLRPEFIDLSAFALVRALAPLGTTANAPARVYVHLATLTNLAVAIGEDCVFTRPLATVWDGGSSEFVTALSEEIRLSIDYYQGQGDTRSVGDVVISGPGARREGMAQEIAPLVGYDVVVAPPLGRFESWASLIPAGDDASRFTVALGLAIASAAS